MQVLGFHLLLIASGVLTAMSDYGGRPSRPLYSFRSAGASRQHKWVGPGRLMPQHVPKPFFLTKWIPHMDPTYIASWVPTLPVPIPAVSPLSSYKGVGSSIPQGFGPLKQSSVVSAYVSASNTRPEYQPINEPISNAIIHSSYRTPGHVAPPLYINPSSKDTLSFPNRPSIPNINTNFNTNATPNNYAKPSTNLLIQPLVRAPHGDPLPISSHESANINHSPINVISTNFLTAAGESESSYTNI